MTKHTFEIGITREEIHDYLVSVMVYIFGTFILGVLTTLLLIVNLTFIGKIICIVGLIGDAYLLYSHVEKFTKINEILKPYREFYGPKKKLSEDDRAADPPVNG